MCMLQCSKCKKLKKENEFNKSKCHKRGYYSSCKECKREWDIQHSEQIKERAKRYYQQNKEKILRQKKDRWKYRPGWRNRSNNYAKHYKHAPKRRFYTYSRHASEKGLSFDITLEQFEDITGKECFYCGEFSHFKEFTGIDRVDNEEGYLLDNIVPCCEFCNRAKLNYAQEEFLRKIEKIYIRMCEVKVL